MAKKFQIEKYIGYKHERAGYSYYCLTCDTYTLSKLLYKLQNKYNSVVVYEQQTFMLMPTQYYEITCK